MSPVNVGPVAQHALKLVDRRRTVALQVGEEVPLVAAHTQVRRLFGQVQADLASCLVNRR
jgi:hypothetical protein